jgi:Ca2+-binding EF-hand superfamily protein
MRYTKIATALSAVMTLGLVTAPVYAEKDPQAKVGKLMQKFDTNQDGQITQEEAAAVRTEFFTGADTNKDGALNLDEYKIAKEKKQEKRFNEYFVKMDVDKNGSLSLEEFLNARKDRMKNITDPESELKNRFTKMDVDNNAALTAQELMEGKKKGICTSGKEDKYDDNPEKSFAQKDADGNGSVSKAEFDAGDKMFGKFDGNKDGIITKDEIVNAIEAKRGKTGRDK